MLMVGRLRQSDKSRIYRGWGAPLPGLASRPRVVTHAWQLQRRKGLV